MDWASLYRNGQQSVIWIICWILRLLQNSLQKFQILTDASMKITVLWDVSSHSGAMMMGAVRNSETLENFYQTTYRKIPESRDDFLVKIFVN
jgi:hypothetical protein